MKKIKLFEAFKLDVNIQKIIDLLLDEEGYDKWTDFLEDQSMGDCQGIIASVARIIKANKLKGFKSVFGEIEITDTAHDESDLGKIMTHHWIVYKNQILDFSKGTLQEFIDSRDFTSIYGDEDALDFKAIRITSL